MPKNQFQGIVYSLIIGFGMAYFMSLYNLTLASTTGFSIDLLGEAFTILFPWVMIIVLLLSNWIMSPLAKKITLKFVNPKEDPQIRFTVVMGVSMVLLMCSSMTLINLFLHGQLGQDWLLTYLVTLGQNLIVALPLQLLVVGPASRWIFNQIFNKKWSHRLGSNQRPARYE